MRRVHSAQLDGEGDNGKGVLYNTTIERTAPRLREGMRDLVGGRHFGNIFAVPPLIATLGGPYGGLVKHSDAPEVLHC